jgi:hypothetical protein
LELKNGSLIKGKFMGGTESEISFQVGSSVQKYNLADIVSLKVDSERAASDQPEPLTSALRSEPQAAEDAGMKTPAHVRSRQERVSPFAPSVQSIPRGNRWLPANAPQ